METGIGACEGKETKFQFDDISGELLIWQSTSDLDDGYYCISTLFDVILIVGVSIGHPFVLTPLFSFENSDGSTLVDLSSKEENPSYYFDFLLSKIGD